MGDDRIEDLVLKNINSVQAQRFRRASGYLEMLKTKNSKLSSQIVQKTIRYDLRNRALSDRLRSSCEMLLNEDSQPVKNAKIGIEVFYRQNAPIKPTDEALEPMEVECVFQSVSYETPETSNLPPPRDDSLPTSKKVEDESVEPENTIPLISARVTKIKPSILKKSSSTEYPQPKTVTKKNRISFDPAVVLMNACTHGDKNEVNEMIKCVADINCTNPSGVSSLSAATIAGHREIVHILILAGANTNIKDKLGWSALHYAACVGDVEICRLLVKNKAAVYSRNRENYIPSDIARDLSSTYPNRQWSIVLSYLLEEQKLLIDTAKSTSSFLFSADYYHTDLKNHLSLTPGDRLEIVDPGIEPNFYCLARVLRGGTENDIGMVPLEILTIYPRLTQV